MTREWSAQGQCTLCSIWTIFPGFFSMEQEVNISTAVLPPSILSHNHALRIYHDIVPMQLWIFMIPYLRGYPQGKAYAEGRALFVAFFSNYLQGSSEIVASGLFPGFLFPECRIDISTSQVIHNSSLPELSQRRKRQSIRRSML